jgi:hypothetical protein
VARSTSEHPQSLCGLLRGTAGGASLLNQGNLLLPCHGLDMPQVLSPTPVMGTPCGLGALMSRVMASSGALQVEQATGLL